MTPVDLVLLLGLLLDAAPCPQDPAVLHLIAQREGFYRARSLPARLHNPGALKFVNQDGAVRGKAGFAEFESDDAGFAALEADIAGKLARGASLRRAWKYFHWR